MNAAVDLVTKEMALHVSVSCVFSLKGIIEQ